MAECSIRIAIASDVASIRQCAVDAYTKYIQRIGRPPAPMVADFELLVNAGQVMVASVDDQLAGFVVFYRVHNAMHLENVAVYPAFSGRGIGRALIRYVEHKAVELGLEYVELYTNEAMTENLSLYPVLGYKEYDRRCEDGFNRVYFRIRASADSR